MPKRIQRKRVKNWKTPDGRYVGRPTRFANPYRLASYDIRHADDTPLSRADHDKEAREMAVRDFRTWLEVTARGQALAEAARRELRGQNLICWCPLDQPCHADVLLAISNGWELKRCRRDLRLRVIGSGDSSLWTDSDGTSTVHGCGVVVAIAGQRLMFVEEPSAPAERARAHGARPSSGQQRMANQTLIYTAGGGPCLKGPVTQSTPTTATTVSAASACAPDGSQCLRASRQTWARRSRLN